MPDGGDGIALRMAGKIGGIDSVAWDACAGPDNPFVSHAFLAALEDSRSVRSKTGWQPLHLVAEDAAGRILGAVPLYAKSHSMGEYVFDHAWADAYERAGGQYYPKLLSAVPFTPVPGPRLLVRPGAPAGTAMVLIRGLESVAAQTGVSSVHVTFPNDGDAGRFEEAGWSMRTGLQYHWENRGYRCFDDFLAALNARKRKTVRRERAEVAANGVRVEALTGDDLRPEHWDAFYRFYQDTTDRKWGGGYLTHDFFHRLGATMADRVVLMMAKADGDWVAGALNLQGTDTLYGRNWGADGRFPFLHFEACYYRAIEHAIERGLKRVEAGAQGEHKIQRGYLPVLTHSAHWIADPGLKRAVDGFLLHERAAIRREAEELAEHSPYRHAEGDTGA
jgi:uncharacterized protein